MNRTWQPPDLAPFEGQFVTLKPLSIEQDAPALYEASHGDADKEAIWRYLPYGPFAASEEMQNWMRQSMVGRADPLPWTVIWKQGAAPVGMVALLSIYPEHGRAEIGHVWLSPKVHKTKVNTETQYLLLRHLFDHKNYRRVEWKCNANNAASRAAATRLGFTFEGRFRQHMWVRGANRDTDWFAMTDKDWPRCKSNFERWLYSDAAESLAALNSG